jgi:hypothetical protein
MKLVLLAVLLVLASTNNIVTDLQAETDGCFIRSRSFYDAARTALTQNSIESIIDSL